MQKSTISAVVITSLVFLGLSGLASGATQNQGTSVQLCIDNRTKELKYSRSWAKCPRGHTPLSLGVVGPQGPLGPVGPAGPSGTGSQGPAGSSISVWNSLEDCNQKLTFALGAGYMLATKRDRDAFESKSGCIVENIRPTFESSIYDAINYPRIVDWEFVSFAGVTEGGDNHGAAQARIGQARYLLTVADKPVGSEFCTIPSQNAYTTSVYIETAPDGRALVRTNLWASQSRLSASLEIGLRYPPSTGCEPLDDILEPFVTVYEDPARFVGPGVNGLEDHLRWWGWE
jgi:hypothetical protein